MASSYTGLGTELMTTGENAGDWGTKTNTNLEILEQAFGGYLAFTIDATSETLAITDGDSTASTSQARHQVIKLSGTLSGNTTVTVELALIVPVNFIILCARTAPVDPSETDRVVVSAEPAMDCAV